jgi:hypothetical protein
VVLGRTPLPALYRLTDKVAGPRVQVGYNMETYLKSVTTLSRDLRTDWRRDRRLDVHSKSRIGLGLLEESSGRSSGPQIRSFGQCQVDESSDGPDPLVGTVVSLVDGNPEVPMSHTYVVRKPTCNREFLATVAIFMMFFYLSLNLLRSEIL